jgi:hypothetical protein
VLLSGIWTSRFVYSRLAVPPSAGAIQTDIDRGYLGAGTVLAVMAILLGILPTPLCLFFIHRAALALLQRSG